MSNVRSTASHTRCLGIRLAAMCVLSLIARPGFADDTVDARQAFDRGVELANAKAYDEALAAFRRAYDLSPNYQVLYNIGEMHRAQGDAASAFDAYQAFLAQGGDGIPRARRSRVESTIATLKAKTAALTIHVTPSSAVVLLDGKSQSPDVLAGPMRVNPGKHKVAASLQDYSPAEEEMVLAAGETATMSLVLAKVQPRAEAPFPAGAAPIAPALAATPEAAPPPGSPAAVMATRPVFTQPLSAPSSSTSSSSSWRRKLGYASGAVGVAGLGFGIVSYFLAQSYWQDAVDRGCNASTCTGQAKSDYDSAKTAMTVTNVAVVSGAVLVAGGLVLILTAPSTSATPSRAAIVPILAPRSGGLALTGRF